MALRLGDFVLRGEIINTERYSTHGYLELRGMDRPLVLQLTGDCSPDLRGRHLRFEVRDSDDGEEFAADGVAWQQIGPTGTMTADRTVKITDCPPEDLYRRSKLGEPPPFEWKRCLYLEWYGQNGRVVVELPDPILEFVDPELDEDPGLPDADDVSDDDSNDDPFDTTLLEGDDEDGPFDGGGGVDESEDDPYGLFPEGFESQFESRAAETDELISSSRSDDANEPMLEIELLDNLIENGDGDPIGTIFDDPIKLRRPEGLDDDEVEGELKTLLAQLAIYGIAIDVCEHYSPRRTYSWLLDEILPKECAYPELRDTQWVQHFSTSDDCPQCDAEFEIELDDRDLRDSDDRDDDLPF